VEILKLEILTPDLHKTAQFYQGVIGFSAIEKTETSISFMAGSTELTFIYTGAFNPVYHFAFNIPHNKLEEAFEWTKTRAEIMDVTPGHKIADFVNWNARSFYFYDNTGNILEFIARYDLDNKSDALFDSKSILNISEIGIATDDVTCECDTLISRYDFPVFSKQPRLQNFTALGDHHGLLILSVENRHWYPTEKLAQKHYTKLEVSNGDQVQRLEFYANT
jgi:catechol-2,3-dioxygenase